MKNIESSLSLQTSLPLYSTPSVLIGLIKCNVTHVTTSQSEIGLFCGVYCPILGQSVKEDKLAGPIKSKLYDKSRILSGCVTFYSVRHEILALFVCISLDICHSSNNFWTSMDHGHLNPKICMGHFGCFDLLVIM